MSDVDVSTIADYLALLIPSASANAGVRSHLVVSGYSCTRRRCARIALKLHVSQPRRAESLSLFRHPPFVPPMISDEEAIDRNLGDWRMRDAAAEGTPCV